MPLVCRFEFFALPEYVQTVSATFPCLEHLKNAAGGVSPTIRIGGTTQCVLVSSLLPSPLTSHADRKAPGRAVRDRATYDPSSTKAATFTIATPGGAPDSLTYGPSYLDLVAKLPGKITVGFPRQLNGLSGTTAAIKRAQSVVPNLFAVELGNEPEFWSSSSPIVKASGQSAWTPALDAQSVAMSL